MTLYRYYPDFCYVTDDSKKSTYLHSCRYVYGYHMYSIFRLLGHFIHIPSELLIYLSYYKCIEEIVGNIIEDVGANVNGKNV